MTFSFKFGLTLEASYEKKLPFNMGTISLKATASFEMSKTKTETKTQEKTFTQPAKSTVSVFLPLYRLLSVVFVWFNNRNVLDSRSGVAFFAQPVAQYLFFFQPRKLHSPCKKVENTVYNNIKLRRRRRSSS